MNIAQKNPQGVTIDTESNSTANKYRGQKSMPFIIYPPTKPLLPVQLFSPWGSHRGGVPDRVIVGEGGAAVTQFQGAFVLLVRFAP